MRYNHCGEEFNAWGCGYKDILTAVRRGYKDILTVVRRGFSNGLYVDTEFLNGLQVVMRGSKNYVISLLGSR